MAEAITDTGPPLHLNEIGHFHALRVFRKILLPPLVAQELDRYGIDLVALGPGVSIEIVPVPEGARHGIRAERAAEALQPADLEVISLAQSDQFHRPVLTDDMAMRRHLEGAGAVVVGTVGILVRAYRRRLFGRHDLETALEALFTESTLHLSPAFRVYVQGLLTDLP